MKNFVLLISIISLIIFVANLGMTFAVTFEEIKTGGSSNSTTVTTSSSLTGVSGNLYLAVVSCKPNRSVNSVSGLGLTWSLVDEQCGGRNQTGVSVWMAQGTPSGNGTVTATLASAPTNATIMVSRYSGVSSSNPIGNVISANSNGVDGSCSGGTDATSYSVNLTTTVSEALVYGAVAIRARDHTPGAGYTERGEVHQGSGGDVAGVATEDKTVSSPGTIAVNGTFSSSNDWAVVAVEIVPTSGPTQYTLTVNTVGSGSVALNPSGGTYNSGTVVTLTATPEAGWQFSNWSGDLSGSTNPTTITMNSNKTVTATFTQIQYTLTVNTVGSGSVALNPSGGTYNSGTAVTLTATPTVGWQFSGWSGDLSGSTNPTTITMNANKSVTATFTEIPAGGDVVFEEVKTGGSSSSATVTSASIAGVGGNLYLAVVSCKPNCSVNSVSGLGLTWSLVDEQCGGRNQTGVSVWMAQGTPSGNGTVTATLASAPTNATIMVSRYSGVSSSNPIGNVISANSNGVDGSCSGGTDATSYSVNLTTTVSGAMVYGAVALRSRDHTPGAGYIERGEVHQGSGGNAAGVATEDKTVSTPGTVAVNGTFSSSNDWAVIAVEIIPGAGGPTQYTLTVNTVGSGSVALNPSGGTYNSGTLVTLTATPEAGWQFSNWSGDLSGSTNPTTITMNANKSVTATFTQTSVQYTLIVSIQGTGTVTLNPPGGIYNSGTVVTLTANPGTDWIFSGWSGDLSGSANPTTITMNANKNVTATFTYQGQPVTGLWSSAAELASAPSSGAAWDAVYSAANQGFYPPVVNNQDSDDNIQCLAAAIIYAKTGTQSYKTNVENACAYLASHGNPGDRTLAWAREVGAYALAADLVGYRASAFETWLRNMAEVYIASDGRTVLEMFHERPNNWGTHGFGMLVSVYAYLGDNEKLNSVRDYWIQGVTGPNPGYTYGELSWHIDPDNPRQINPAGSVKSGLNIDGVMPDDMRRGGSFSNPPGHTGYAWEAIQGIIMAARVLERYDPDLSIWEVDNNAIYRAGYILQVEWENDFGDWAATGDDEWMIPFFDDAYGTNWSDGSTDEWGAGKNTGWAYVLLGVSGMAKPKTPEMKESVVVIPEAYCLHQNYPNPFNPVTNIQFDLPEAGRVTVIIYDMMGRKVATIVDGFRNAGTYAVEWNAIDSAGHRLPSGIYLCRMQSGPYLGTIKIMVMR